MNSEVLTARTLAVNETEGNKGLRPLLAGSLQAQWHIQD